MREKNNHFRFAEVISFGRKQMAQPYAAFVLGALLGLLFFTVFYGLKVVDPLFTDWLIGGGDIKQHFMGWSFFREEPWTFPIGSIERLAYPFGMSLTYMDSIPLFAIPFKLFAAWLPDNFQYFGIWGLLCFMLQGGIAAMIMRRYTKHLAVALLCAAVFIVSPLLLQRMFVHTALASQWIVLAALWAMLEHRKIVGTKRQLAVWSGLCALAVLVHPYFLPMVMLPLILSAILTHRIWLATAAKLLVPPAVGMLVFWVIGGLVIEVNNAATEEIGAYALNLNSLVNSLGWSQFLPPITNYSDSGEALNYLGLGILLLVPVVFYIAVTQAKSVAHVQEVLKKLQWRHGLMALAVAGFCILAISPKVQLGTEILLEVHLPEKVRELWSVFRATARLFWPLYYLLIIGILAYVLRSMRRVPQLFLAVFLAVFVALQTIDIVFSYRSHMRHSEIYEVTKPGYRRVSPINLTRWKEAVGDKKHFIFLEKMEVNEFFILGDVPMAKGMTINTGYFARAPYDKIEAYQDQQKNLLNEKKADLQNNVYVTRDTEFIRNLRGKGYDILYLEGYYIINQSP